MTAFATNDSHFALSLININFIYCQFISININSRLRMFSWLVHSLFMGVNLMTVISFIGCRR